MDFFRELTRFPHFNFLLLNFNFLCFNFNILGVFFVLVQGRVVLEEEGAEQVDEEVEVEVAESEEGEFDGAAVEGGEDDLGDVGGGGETEVVVVGFEVAVEDFDVSGEEVRGRRWRWRRTCGAGGGGGGSGLFFGF